MAWGPRRGVAKPGDAQDRGLGGRVEDSDTAEMGDPGGAEDWEKGQAGAGARNRYGIGCWSPGCLDLQCTRGPGNRQWPTKLSVAPQENILVTSRQASSPGKQSRRCLFEGIISACGYQYSYFHGKLGRKLHECSFPPSPCWLWVKKNCSPSPGCTPRPSPLLPSHLSPYPSLQTEGPGTQLWP